MESITIEMPVVSECSATECAYNRNRACQARAITVGNGVHAGCDTYCDSTQRAKRSLASAGIGACKMADCKFNDGLECMAPSIQMGRVQKQVNCMTYSAR